MRWMHAMRARARLLFRGAAEARMEEEIRFHLEMEAEKLVCEGMTPDEARRRAVLAFGGVEGHKEEMRDGRTFAWTNGLSLDLKLGLRMLMKYPGLTLVGVLGMAVAIAIGATTFQVLHSVMDPALPLDEGDRVVAIQQRPVAGGNPERRVLHDFAVWREAARSLQDLGAFRTLSRNLIVPGGSIERIDIIAMTASGFRMARVPPLLGRYLLDEDERAGATPVIVIGYREWKTRFGGDPGVVGREIRLDNTLYTVVGVMPEGFAFPFNNSYWTPLQAGPTEYGPREGPAAYVFGRLAPGVTMAAAEAELAAISRGTAAAPESEDRLLPQVVPYTRPWFELDTPVMLWLFHTTQVLVSMLLVVIAVNVAILVYARTATRTGEIAVRSALGASRRRILMQLFVEGLVLSVGAAALGLVIARLGLGRLSAFADRLPFWLDFGLSPATMLYTAGLALLGALIVGVVPALKVTGRRMESSLRQLGGGTGMRMGRMWTVLIVAQVAIAVAVLPVAVALAWNNELVRGDFALTGPGLAAEEILTARLAMDAESLPGTSASERQEEHSGRITDRQTELLRRLEAEPGVSQVTFVSRLPGQEFSGTIEVASARPATSVARTGVQFLQVDLDFFDVFGAHLLAGRAFLPGDLAGPATAVVVNRSFVERVLGGGDALGRQLRYTRTEDRLEPGRVEQGHWYEIVGVVEDFAAEVEGVPMLYHPASPGELNPLSLIVRVRGNSPEMFAGRLKQIAAALDPTLQLDEVLSMEQIHHQSQQLRRWVELAIALATLSVLLLSAAGIHALMSLTVTQRRKEIGIRAALGANPRRVLGNIFARALRQLAIGVSVGLGMAALLDHLTGGALMGGAGTVLLPAMGAIMTMVGLLAALGPARRGLRIQPMEALREE